MSPPHSQATLSIIDSASVGSFLELGQVAGGRILPLLLLARRVGYKLNLQCCCGFKTALFLGGKKRKAEDVARLAFSLSLSLSLSGGHAKSDSTPAGDSISTTHTYPVLQVGRWCGCGCEGRTAEEEEESSSKWGTCWSRWCRAARTEGAVATEIQPH